MVLSLIGVSSSDRAFHTLITPSREPVHTLLPTRVIARISRECAAWIALQSLPFSALQMPRSPFLCALHTSLPTSASAKTQSGGSVITRLKNLPLTSTSAWFTGGGRVALRFARARRSKEGARRSCRAGSRAAMIVTRRSTTSVKVGRFSGLGCQQSSMRRATSGMRSWRGTRLGLAPAMICSSSWLRKRKSSSSKGVLRRKIS
mmetsp:Transcript_5669/g.21980  ORF Transcript_5669/g.21980 Transcript_5669/m.21980 type:complete len:204 (+) Transcript_5669:1204-1815(+)